ncbi:PIH1 domain-containing protein 2 [Biomphalaria glabrata]|nr:PIH1 domain-containing protein 2 [Biomphalaria glabrata]
MQTESLNSDQMASKAQQIWAMLDDMAENDPAAYQKFIDQQMKEGRDNMTLPEPHMCVLVTMCTKPPKKLYINFCSWKRVPEPKSPQDPVPVTGIPITHEESQEGSFALTSVAFNPQVLEEYGRNAKNPVDGDTLIQLALDYIEAQCNVKVHRTYTVLSKDILFKGDFDHVRLQFKNVFKRKEPSSGEGREQEDVLGSIDTENLLHQILNISGSQKISDKKTVNSVLQTNKDKKLIEEIKDIKLTTPKYSLETVNMRTEKHLVLKVELCNANSVSQCELDISEDDVFLLVPGLYELKVKLPNCINDESAKAKFCKKTSTLTVTMPFKY